MPLVGLEKERHRLIVKKSYHRQLQLVQSLRDQVTGLEVQYKNLLQRQREQEQQVAIQPDIIQNGDTLVKPEAVDKDGMLSAYMQLCKLKDQLRAENQALRDRTAEYEECAIKLTRFTKILEEERSTPPPSHLLVEPLTAEECSDLVRMSWVEMCKFFQSSGYLSTGASVFGWRDKHKVDSSKLQFSVKKLLHGQQALPLHMELWNTISSPQGHARLFSASLHPTVHQLQRIDDDTVVHLRVFHNPDQNATAKALSLLHRFQVKQGYFILLRPLMRELRENFSATGIVEDKTDKNEQWLDMFTWILFENVGPNLEYCEVSFGGVVGGTKVASIEVWLLEVLIMCLRWENRTFGPRFSLVNSE